MRVKQKGKKSGAKATLWKSSARNKMKQMTKKSIGKNLFESTNGLKKTPGKSILESVVQNIFDVDQDYYDEGRMSKRLREKNFLFESGVGSRSKGKLRARKTPGKALFDFSMPNGVDDIDDDPEDIDNLNEDDDLFKSVNVRVSYKVFLPPIPPNRSQSSFGGKTGRSESSSGNLYEMSRSKSDIMKRSNTRQPLMKNSFNSKRDQRGSSERSLQKHSDDSELFLHMFLDFFRDLYTNNVKTPKSKFDDSRELSSKSSSMRKSNVNKRKMSSKGPIPTNSSATSNQKRQVRFDPVSKSESFKRTNPTNRRCNLLEQSFKHGAEEIINMIKQQGANVKNVIEERERILQSIHNIRNELVDTIRCVPAKSTESVKLNPQ